MSRKSLVLPIILTMLLSGCGINVQATQPKKTPKTLPVTSVKEIAYQFKTDMGQIITVVDDTSIDGVYTTPKSTIDTQCSRMPIEIQIGDFLIDIGFAEEDQKNSINDNVYQGIYGAMIDELLNARSGKTSKNTRDKLDVYKDLYPNNVIDTLGNFSGKDLSKGRETIWSSSPVNYTAYCDIQPFNLPVITATTKLDTGEYLVIHCLASIDSGYWQLEDFPSLADVLTKNLKSMSTERYDDNIEAMHTGYKKAASTLCSVINNIKVGDYSTEYVVLSLDNKSIYQSNFGVDTSLYDKYAFIRLDDNSIYLVYESNGLKGCECIAGDIEHSLSTDWDTYDTQTTDSTTGIVYHFNWVLN